VLENEQTRTAVPQTLRSIHAFICTLNLNHVGALEQLTELRFAWRVPALRAGPCQQPLIGGLR
jgi:hypothetical protein